MGNKTITLHQISQVLFPDSGSYHTKFIWILALLVLKINFVQSEELHDTIWVTDFGIKPNSLADASACIQKAIEGCRNKKHPVLIFPAGRYDFWPQNAVHKRYYISNTSSAEEVPDKTKYIGLFFEQFNELIIEGNHAHFIFHGKMTPWALVHCSNIRLENITIDFERPTISELKILEISPDSITVNIHPDSKFTLNNQHLVFYGEGWEMIKYHAVLVHPATGVYTYSNWLPFAESRASIISPGKIRFYGNFSGFHAEPGDVLTVRDPVRDQVGAFINHSKNIFIKNLTIRYMHGLGIVSQFSEDLNFDHLEIAPDPNHGRMISCFADALHFSGCKGNISIEHAHFKGLHDDPINIHGTHLEIREVISTHKARVAFMHPQTYGFQAFFPGDSIALVHGQSLQIFKRSVVTHVKMISEKEMDIELEDPLFTPFMKGDCLENLTWTPSATVRNCIFECVNTRGLLVSSRKKVLIENNLFYRTGMYAILISNDASQWYESGEVEDIAISNNVFEDCGYNLGNDDYAIAISPEIHTPLHSLYTEKNIRIENNIFKLHSASLLKAFSVDKLTFNNNIIFTTHFMPSQQNRFSIQMDHCNHVQVLHNTFHTEWKSYLHLLDMNRNQIQTNLPIISLN